MKRLSKSSWYLSNLYMKQLFIWHIRIFLNFVWARLKFVSHEVARMKIEIFSAEILTVYSTKSNGSKHRFANFVYLCSHFAAYSSLFDRTLSSFCFQTIHQSHSPFFLTTTRLKMKVWMNCTTYLLYYVVFGKEG